MSGLKDLTRWNRSGLARFRYINGNAIEYLEVIRQRMVELYGDPDTERCDWIIPSEITPENEQAQENESLVTRQERLSRRQDRLVDMYYQDRRDWAWEISRTFARSCHILTEYANAYANEFYLGTATQWDHVRRLVEMLDYHPAPPASAYTRLIITAKDDKKGVVPAGFQVQHTPGTGGPKIVFETLKDIKIDAALNELRPKGWNRSGDPVVKAPPGDEDNGTSENQLTEFSSLANEYVSVLHGISSTIQQQLDELVSVNERFRIKDFLDLEPENSGTTLSPVILNEFKSRAIYLCEFELDNAWKSVYTWTLTSLLEEDPANSTTGSVQDLSGKSADEIAELQQQLSLVAVFIDQQQFSNLLLQDLIRLPLAAATTTEKAQGSQTTVNQNVSVASVLLNNSQAESEAANWPALYLQGIGNELALHLDAVKSELGGLLNNDQAFRIIDLLSLDPEQDNTGIHKTQLKGLIARAKIISDFDPGSGWDDIYSWQLADIIETSSQVIANSINGKTESQVNDLKSQIEVISSVIDQYLFLNSTLGDLYATAGVFTKVSTVAVKPVVYLQGVDNERAWRLNLFKNGQTEQYPQQYHFKIKDFMSYQLESDVVSISEKRLADFIAIAREICEFELQEGWSSIINWRLQRISSEDAEFLADFTGNTIDEVRGLQQKINLISSYIDHPQFESARLKELLQPYVLQVQQSASVATDWKATIKPKIKPDQVVMIYRKDTAIAEAATVESVEEESLDIHLLRDQVNYSWTGWPKGELELNAHPRWKKSCWLNGRDVIRTKSPHGLSEDSYIGWRYKGKWQYAKVIETDKFNLRLDYKGRFPQADTLLYQLSPITDAVLSKEYEVVAIKGPQEDIVEPELNVTKEEPSVPDPAGKLFTVPAAACEEADIPAPPSSGGGGFLPPASLPKIGSFLFPSPMLPMDLVKIAVELMLSLGVMVIPSTGEIVFKGLPPDMGGDSMIDASDLVAMIDAIKIPKMNCDDYTLKTITVDGKEIADTESVIWNPDMFGKNPSPQAKVAAMEELLNTAESNNSSPLFKKIQNDLENIGPSLIIETKPEVVAVVDENDYRFMFNGNPGKVSIKDWVVGRFTDGLRALQVIAVKNFIDKEKNQTFALDFNNLVGNEPELENVYALFNAKLVAEGASVNSTELGTDPIELDEIPEELKVGKDVMLTAEGKAPVHAVIKTIESNGITTSPAAIGFTAGDLVINANVIDAGHGVSKPWKILGSGDASKTSQSFVLAVAGISFTPDVTKSSGVAAAIQVEVERRIWEQVSTLKDSAPDDHHYSIRMTEEGYIKILFGDGEHGRRLPTGKNNIRVKYRVGSGTSGNVTAGSLVKPVNPHPYIKSIGQPQQAAGGGDIEDVSSLRENAPPKLLALERAVSLSDFSHLAMGQSSIWQAKAFLDVQSGSRADHVTVVIVPSGGVVSDDVNNSIRDYLQSHSLPDVNVSVISFNPVRFNLSLTLRIKIEEFVIADVEDAVRSAIDDHFSLQNRKLGEHLYLSEIYKIVENVKGVENSVCVINDDTGVQVLKAGNTETVIYFDRETLTTPSTLIIESEGYEP